MAYPVVDVSNWAVMSDETGGEGRDKRWLARSSESLPDQWWLWKPAKEGQRPPRGGGAPQRFRWIDHYVERIACELAGLLRLPAARIELADLAGEMGSLSLNVAPLGYSRREGDMLLSDLASYKALHQQERQGAGADRTGHTLDNIRRKLIEYVGPPCQQLC